MTEAFVRPSRGLRILLAIVLLLTGGLVAATAEAAVPSERGRSFTAEPLTMDSRVDAEKAPTSRLAKSDAALLKRTDTAPVRVLIKLDYEAIASYQGGVAGLEATSPGKTGKELRGDSTAQREYTSYIHSRESEFTDALRKAVPGAEVERSLRVVYGGVVAMLPANASKTVDKLPGVVAVQADRMNKLLTDSSPDFLNASHAYKALGTTASAGKGVLYGNLDTGIWPEHPSFADHGNLPAPPGTARECNYGDNPLTPAADPFVCNKKLIGGAHFADSYDQAVGDDMFEGTARDSNGHGTHTASTSAGNIVDDVSILGSRFGRIQGLAPGAWVMEYKVCGPQGCFSSDSAAAVEQAILDGVDVINFSISGGTDPFTDPVELAFLDAYAAGILVATSAGNSGPGAGTTNHLSPWVTTVAASTQTREFSSTLTLTASNGETFTADGASVTPGAGPLPVVLSSAAPYSNRLCDQPAPAGSFTGRIVACERGVNARVDKGYNVRQGGAAGMVLYNPTLADTGTDTHWLPAIQLADGRPFVTFMNGHTDVTGSFTAGRASDGEGDVIAAFSSRGPGGTFLKPDVTAPGVQILAGDTPISEGTVSGPAGEYYQAIAGTSMSSPHVAGAALLVRAVHPDWTPGQIKSALMTTALTDLVKEDLTTPADPFDFGAGRIDIGRSIRGSLTLDETAANFLALGNDRVRAVHLNLPSINAPVMPGMLETTRTVTNTSSRSEEFEVRTRVARGSSISVSPPEFRLRPGESRTLDIVIRSEAPIGAQQFGSIELSSDRGMRQHLPVAFVHTQGSVGLTQACTPTSIVQGGVTECTVEAVNQSFDDQVVDLDSFVGRDLKIVDAEGATLVGDRAARRHDVTLAGARPGAPAVDPGQSPGGYVPLDQFVAPHPVGDEAIINFDTPAFEYAGQTWTGLGVDSNGYVVAGHATAEDNNCCNLPDGPDPARPNNMLAPFWTDLDGTGTPGIYAAALSDGTNRWIVIEYRVNVFGTQDLKVFQTWIGLNGVEDISYTYDAAHPPTNPGMDFLVGAENQLGQGDIAAVVPAGDLRVDSTDAVPGDRATYKLRVRGEDDGVERLTSEMRASRVPGVTVVNSDIRVTSR